MFKLCIVFELQVPRSGLRTLLPFNYNRVRQLLAHSCRTRLSNPRMQIALFYMQAKLRTNIRRFKKYRPLIIEFIELIRRFINHDAIKVVLDEQSVQDLKEKLKCKLTKSTKNYVLFSWLKTFLTSF